MKQYADTVLHERAEGWRGVHARGRRYDELTRPDGSRREEAAASGGASKLPDEFWSWVAKKNSPTKGTDRLGRPIRTRTLYRDQWEDANWVAKYVPPKEEPKQSRAAEQRRAERSCAEQSARERVALAQLGTVDAAAAAASRHESRQRLLARQKESRAREWRMLKEVEEGSTSLKPFGNFYEGIVAS